MSSLMCRAIRMMSIVSGRPRDGGLPATVYQVASRM